MKKILIAATTIVALVLFIIIAPACWGASANQAQKIIDYVEKNGEQYNGNFKLWVICKNHDVYFVVISATGNQLEIVYYRTINQVSPHHNTLPFSNLSENLLTEIKNGKLDASARVDILARVKDNAVKLIEYEHREIAPRKSGNGIIPAETYFFSYAVVDYGNNRIEISPVIKKFNKETGYFDEEVATPEEIDKIQQDYESHLRKICQYMDLK